VKHWIAFAKLQLLLSWVDRGAFFLNQSLRFNFEFGHLIIYKGEFDG
jgi:hypothetical protein